MKHKSLWLFIIFIISIAIFLFGIYIFFEPFNSANRIFKNDIEIKHSDIFSKATFSETISLRGGLSVPLLEAEGFLFPQIEETVSKTISADFTTDKIEVIEEDNTSEVDDYRFGDDLIIENSEFFLEVISKGDYRSRRGSDNWTITLGTRASEMVIEKELEVLLKNKFGGSVEVANVQVNLNGDSKIIIDLNTEIEHRSGFSIHVENAELTFELKGTEIDTIMSENNLDSKGAFIIDEYSYSLLLNSYNLAE